MVFASGIESLAKSEAELHGIVGGIVRRHPRGEEDLV